MIRNVVRERLDLGTFVRAWTLDDEVSTRAGDDHRYAEFATKSQMTLETLGLNHHSWSSSVRPTVDATRAPLDLQMLT